MLKTRVKFNGFDDPKTTLAEALDNLAQRYDIAFEVNEKAFVLDGLNDVLRFEVAQPNPITPMDARLSAVLRKVLARVPVQSGAQFLIRKEYIEITTGSALQAELDIPAERRLLPLVWESFDGTPLPEALQVLGDDTGFNVVIDPRVADKMKTPVKATLRNVPVDTAVRLLAAMDDLQPVLLDNVFYITTPEKARRLAEQEASTPKPAGGPAKKAAKPGPQGGM
jgi:hypothetical protein